MNAPAHRIFSIKPYAINFASDVMFRFQRMLSMQAQACQKLSRAILLREPYQHDAHFERAFMHLDAALARARRRIRRAAQRPRVFTE